MLQLLYYITFRSFCQVNILWTEVQMFSFHSFSPWPAFLFYHILSILSSKHFMNWSSFRVLFPFSSTACPKQSAYLFYHTSIVLSSELFLNNFLRSLSISRSVSRFSLSSILSTFALVRQLYYYITLLLLCQVENCKEYKLDFIYSAHMYSAYSKTGSDDTPPKPVSPLFAFYRFNSFISVPIIKGRNLFE